MPRYSSFDRVPDLPVVPQKGDSTVQSLIKVVDAVVYDSCPWSRQCTEQLRSPIRSSTSLFSLSEQEVPQIEAMDEPGEGVFALFPIFKKVRHNLRTLGRNCPRTRAHGRRQLMTSLWCSRRRRRSPRMSWVRARRQECWWLGAADGSQIGPTIWQPPWLIG